jgi:hypothetical protein
MIAVTSKFEVRNGMEDEVKDAIRNRPKLVENAKGFSTGCVKPAFKACRNSFDYVLEKY